MRTVENVSKDIFGTACAACTLEYAAVTGFSGGVAAEDNGKGSIKLDSLILCKCIDARVVSKMVELDDTELCAAIRYVSLAEGND